MKLNKQDVIVLIIATNLIVSLSLVISLIFAYFFQTPINLKPVFVFCFFSYCFIYYYTTA